jgi:ABC-type multidrug transport system fused ATPase/permease subunit
MISSFVVTLIECLEIAFITLLVSRTDNPKKIYLFGLIGLVVGALASKFLHDTVEAYEWLSYTLLSLLMFYLFTKGKDVAKHVKEHVDEMSNSTNIVLIALTVVLIYGRESFEIFTHMMLNQNSNWYAAGAAVVVAVGLFLFARSNKAITTNVFKFGHWAYLVFAGWFAYEAFEHIEKVFF